MVVCRAQSFMCADSMADWALCQILWTLSPMFSFTIVVLRMCVVPSSLNATFHECAANRLVLLRRESLFSNVYLNFCLEAALMTFWVVTVKSNLSTPLPKKQVC